MVGIWVSSSTETNGGSIVPLHETTLVSEYGIRVCAISDQDGLKSVLRRKTCTYATHTHAMD